MATHITQHEDFEGGRTVLKVAGEMMREDAVLLRRIATDIAERSKKPVTLDIADVELLDSESAPIIRQLMLDPRFRVEGVEIFLQSAVNKAERAPE